MILIGGEGSCSSLRVFIHEEVLDVLSDFLFVFAACLDGQCGAHRSAEHEDGHDVFDVSLLALGLD